LRDSPAGDFSAYNVPLAAVHVQRVCGEEVLNPALNLRAIPSFRDGLMQASLVRLSSRTEGRQISEEIGDEIAARQIVLRLCVLVGGSVPEWQKDTSVFTPIVMRQVVASIDAHLGVPLTLECMARASAASSIGGASPRRSPCSGREAYHPGASIAFAYGSISTQRPVQ
jgi:hypothetical protein